MLLADRRELGRQVDILKPTPAAERPSTSTYSKSFAFGDPLVHHLGERRPSFGVQPRLAGVTELMNDLDAVFLRPLRELDPVESGSSFLVGLEPSADSTPRPEPAAARSGSGTPISHQLFTMEAPS